MHSLEEDASKAEVRNGKASNHQTEQRHTCSQCVGEVQDGIEHKAPHNYQQTLPVDLPLQWEGVLIEEANGVPISQP